MILARTQNEMKRAAYCAVQMIQNVSKNRTNKKITLNDIKNITRAWMIMVPYAKKLLDTDLKKIVYISTNIILVEGTAINKCKIKWYADREFKSFGEIRTNIVYKGGRMTTNTDGSSSSNPTAFSISTQVSSLHPDRLGTTVNINQEISSTTLYKDLHIKEGEIGKIKVVLELAISVAGNSAKPENLREFVSKPLGLRIINPSSSCGTNSWGGIWFLSHVIFTPINGIFDENNPPS